MTNNVARHPSAHFLPRPRAVRTRVRGARGSISSLMHGEGPLMVVEQNAPEVIDSDGHVVEPDSLWREYSDPGYREFLSSSPGGGVQRLAVERAYPDANVGDVL